MLHTILPQDMKRVEARMMAGTGTGSLTLMERAATHLADAAAPLLRGGGRLLAVCGPGNNGADGLAAARLLMGRMPALQTTVWKLAGEPSPETAEQWARLKPLMARVQAVALADDAPPPPLPKDVTCALDAMYGTGQSRPLAGAALAVARMLNAAGAPVVAVDIPSGLDGATGQVLGGAAGGDAVRATVTVTFHRPKQGLFLGDGLDLCGRVVVGDIGIPAAWDDADGLAVLNAGDRLLPARRRNSHKGDYGRVLLLCGSFGMAGAAAIAATAALRAGAGLVTVACPGGVVPAVQALCPCATCLPLPDADAAAGPEAAAGEAYALLRPLLFQADVLVVGCGLGQGAWAQTLLEKITGWLTAHHTPAVFDADALNWLAAAATHLPRLPEHIVLTPHIGEAARLLGTNADAVLADQPAAARALRAKYGGAVALKSASTVLACADGEAINLYGTPAMAKGGSGDALAGIIGAMLAGREAYGLSGVRLLQTACALHGLAGLTAAETRGERGLLATDLCEALGRVPDVPERGVASVAALAGGTPATYETDTLAMHDPSEEYAALQHAAMMDAPARGGRTPHNPREALGRRVRVTVDRPLGTRHPEHRDVTYTLNYGYVSDVLAADNEWQDAYVWGVKEPVVAFEGEVVAVIHRLNDVEDKWVVAAAGTHVTEAEIREGTRFVEQFFKSEIWIQ